MPYQHYKWGHNRSENVEIGQNWSFFYYWKKQFFIFCFFYLWKKTNTNTFFFVKKMFRNIVFHFLKKLIICPTGLCQKKKHAKNIEQIALIWNQIKLYMYMLLLIQFWKIWSKTVDVFFFFDKVLTFFRF